MRARIDMKINVNYYLEEPYTDQERIETINKQEYAKLQKRLRLINYLFQYLVPTLFVTIILLR